jgi:hypothetical protein
MVRTIKQIRQDLESLETEVADISEQLRSVYLKYCQVLGQSVQKQLILASYQICTQVYPEAFLKISFNKRQKIQQNIRQLAKQIQSQLLTLLDLPVKINVPQNSDLLEQILKKLSLNQRESTSQEQETAENLAAEPQPPPTIPQNETQIVSLTTEIPEEIKENLIKLKNNPDLVIQWQRQLEKVIVNTLDKLSYDVNKLLQESDILPSQLPTKFIDVAIQAEENGAAISGPPNLLNMLVETEIEDDAERSPAPMTQITVIRLRLLEIEFSEPSLSILRQQIRQILTKLETIRQKYQKKQQELAIAEAESAWRASWYEE